MKLGNRLGDVVFGMRIVLVICGILTIVTGCALSPATSDVQAFGKAAKKATAAISVPDQMQTELLLRTTVNQNACSYLRGGKYTLAAIGSNESLELIKEQAKFVKTLDAYAGALASATDPDGVAKLRAAASGFSGALSGVAAATPGGPASSAVVGPVVKIIVNGVVDFSELQRRRAIKEIMIAADDAIVRGGRRIRQDYEKIGDHLDKIIGKWDASSRCVLAVVRTRDSTGAYELFKQFDAKRREYRAKRGTLNEAVNLMGDIVRLHEQLILSEGDFQDSLTRFNELIGEFSYQRFQILTHRVIPNEFRL